MGFANELPMKALNTNWQDSEWEYAEAGYFCNLLVLRSLIDVFINDPGLVVRSTKIPAQHKP